MRDTMNSTRNTKKRICAIPEAVPAMPPNPNSAAIRAITKKRIANPNIGLGSLSY